MTKETDRELLELAAKAAGVDRNLYTWNPIDENEEAFCLAVKLGIHLQFAMDYAVAYAGSVHAKQFTELCGNDPYEATRRAIVRAAAEIGRSMP